MKNGNFKKLISSLAIVATAALTACGGGGGGGGGSAASPAGTAGPTALTPTVVVTPLVTGTVTGTVSTAVVTTTPTSVVMPPVISTTPTVVVTPPVISTKPAYTLANPPGASYPFGTAQRQMFDTLNQIRIGGGFSALEQDARLDQAAKAHADYGITNYYPDGVGSAQLSVVTPDGWFTAHTELLGVDGFTGARPANRVAMTGYQAVTTGEVISYKFGQKPGLEPDMSICLSLLLNSVFHRAALLDTSYLDIGIGISKPVTDKNGFILRQCVIDFAAKQAAPVLPQGWFGIYPFDAQTNAQLAMGPERPDPIVSAPVKGGPISIQTASRQNLLVTSFVLRDASGLAVNSKVLTRTDSTFLRTNEAYLVPIRSLAANSSYFVTFSGTSNGTLINKSWTFRTAVN